MIYILSVMMISCYVKLRKIALNRKFGDFDLLSSIFFGIMKQYPGITDWILQGTEYEYLRHCRIFFCLLAGIGTIYLVSRLYREYSTSYLGYLGVD